MKKSIVILANGCFPTHDIPLSVLNNAETIICTDGSADKLLAYGKSPDVIIGDMDSIRLSTNSDIRRVHIPNQNNTDLEKAVEWCIEQDIESATILGSQGERDDHGFATMFIQSTFVDKITLSIITDYSIIDCITNEKTFSSFPEQTVSIISVNHTVHLTTKGLKYTLKTKPLSSPTQGVSNTATEDHFSIQTTGSIWVFRSHK